MENKFFKLQRIKGKLRKLAPVPFVIGGLVLFVMTVMNMPLLSHIREQVMTGLAPIVSVLSAPVRAFRNASESIADHFYVYEKNKELLAENEQLRSWHKMAIKLAQEQKELFKLLNYHSVADGKESVVRVLADYNSPFSQSLILNAGREEEIHKGDVLVSNKGLIGFVQSVGKRTARALKITDYYARLPVYVGDERVVAIMSGNNSRYPTLTSLPEESDIKEGDYVMTAGTAGVYPSGIPVGEVRSVTRDGISVTLFETADNLEFVRVIDFGLGGLLPDSCAAEQAASETERHP